MMAIDADVCNHYDVIRQLSGESIDETSKDMINGRRFCVIIDFDFFFG